MFGLAQDWFCDTLTREIDECIEFITIHHRRTWGGSNY
jgi:hypothetical protein